MGFIDYVNLLLGPKFVHTKQGLPQVAQLSTFIMEKSLVLYLQRRDLF